MVTITPSGSPLSATANCIYETQDSDNDSQGYFHDELLIGGSAVYCTNCCGVPTDSDFVIAELSDGAGASDPGNDGDLDTRWGSSGVVRTNFQHVLCGGCIYSADSDYGLMEWEDNNTGTWYVIAVGSTSGGSSADFAVARYFEEAQSGKSTTGGLLDTAFGNAGSGTQYGLSIGPTGTAYAGVLEGTSVSDSNATILAAGTDGSRFEVARFSNLPNVPVSGDTAGGLDTSFGGSGTSGLTIPGVFVTDFGTASQGATDVARSIDIELNVVNGSNAVTDIIAGGYTYTSGNNAQIAMADYLPGQLVVS